MMNFLLYGGLAGGGYGTTYSSYSSGANASQALTEAEQARAEVQHLRDALHRSAIANEAMWQILSAKLGVTEDELRQTIATVEKQHEQDHGPITCPGCHRPTSRNYPKCYYCGAYLGPTPIFE